MLASLTPYDQPDLAMLFAGEPWLNRNNHIRFYAGNGWSDLIPWTARILDPMLWYKELKVKEDWEELKSLQS